jgi:hypothetical protein
MADIICEILFHWMCVRLPFDAATNAAILAQLIGHPSPFQIRCEP